MMDVAFRSGNADVLRAFDDYQESYRQMNDRRAEFKDRYGASGVMLRRSGFGHGTVVSGLPGISAEAAKRDPYLVTGDREVVVEIPDGWRCSTKAGHLIPNLRKKVGKEIEAEMRGLRDPGPNFPGMPPFHIGGTGMRMAVHSPAYFLHDGLFYCFWGCDLETFHSIDDRHADKVDLTLWEKIPLSAYYFAKEQYEIIQQEKETVDG